MMSSLTIAALTLGVAFNPGVSCPGYEALGCYVPATRSVYVNDLDPFVVYHELGHAFDDQRMTPQARATFARLVKQPWNSEVFADSFASCTLDGPKYPKFSGHGFPYQPTPRRFRRVCQLLVRVAERH